MEPEWVVLEETFGLPQAELLRSYLEAQGIPVVLNQEGAGHALGLTIGTLGRVEVLVPVHSLEKARQSLVLINPGVEAEAAEDEIPPEEQSPDTAAPEDPQLS